MTDDLAAFTAFINARLDEDEAAAKAAASLQADPENGWGIDGRAITPHIGVIHEHESRAHIARHDPARVLREVAAKRALLATYDEAVNGINADLGVADALEGVMRHEGTVWSGHPDYRESWKP